MSVRERARRRFLARAGALGMPPALAASLWSRARSSSVWPDAVSLTGTRVEVGRTLHELVDVTGSIRRMHFTETPAGTVNRRNEIVAARPWSADVLIEQRALRAGKRSLLDRLLGRS